MVQCEDDPDVPEKEQQAGNRCTSADLVLACYMPSMPSMSGVEISSNGFVRSMMSSEEKPTASPHISGMNYLA